MTPPQILLEDHPCQSRNSGIGSCLGCKLDALAIPPGCISFSFLVQGTFGTCCNCNRICWSASWLTASLAKVRSELFRRLSKMSLICLLPDPWRLQIWKSRRSTYPGSRSLDRLLGSTSMFPSSVCSCFSQTKWVLMRIRWKSKLQGQKSAPSKSFVWQSKTRRKIQSYTS